MKKIVYAIAFLFFAFLVVYTAAKFLGYIELYVTPTTANEPSLKAKSYIWTSKLKKPKRFDHICFMDKVFNTDKVDMFVYRLCGLPKDKIEIKDGILYINDINVDANLEIKYAYMIPKYTASQLNEAKVLSKEDTHLMNLDSAYVFLSRKQIKDNNVRNYRRVSLSKSDVNEIISAAFQNNWNQEHFGPIIVPDNHCFVLGDNRMNAEDSRFRGFIPLENVKSTVVFYW